MLIALGVVLLVAALVGCVWLVIGFMNFSDPLDGETPDGPRIAWRGFWLLLVAIAMWVPGVEVLGHSGAFNGQECPPGMLAGHHQSGKSGYDYCYSPNGAVR